MARPRGSSRARAPRRRTSWEEGTGGTTPTNFTGTVSQFLGSALSFLEDGLTVLRFRGYLRAILTAVAGANDGFSGAMGIGMTTTAAITAGAASVPLPIDEQDWDGWLYWRAFSLQSATATIGDGVNAVGVALDYEIDSKAMRKVGEDMALYAVLQSVENGTSVMDVWHDSRVLLALP